MKQLSAKELAAWMKAGKPMEVFDVRTPGERVTAHIEGTRALDASGKAVLEALEKDTVLVFRYVEVNGTGFGLGTAITAVLAIESTHGALDHLEVTIGPDRKVRAYRMAETPHETPIWPSDD